MVISLVYQVDINDLNASKNSSSIEGFPCSLAFALLMLVSKFVPLFGIFDARFGPIFTKKLLNVLAIVVLSVISTSPLINSGGKESHVPLFFTITSLIFHVFFMLPSKSFNLS